MKLGEFLALNQITKTMTQYLHAFNNLCRYAPNMVDIDAKRIASFKRGLSPKMMKHVGTNTHAGFNDFISDCLKQEKNTTRTLHSRLARGSLSQDHHSLEFSLLTALPTVRLHQVQGLGRHNIKPRTTRDHRRRTRWLCHQQK
jgi:hypothetical protein